MILKKDEIKNTNFVNNDPVESYFECISSCDISDGKCITKCVEILKECEH